jgi:hypothetical protein
MTVEIRTYNFQNTDDLDRSILIDNPEGIIYDSEDPDQFNKVRYWKKHGAVASIAKYGKSTRRIYEKLGLVYPGDPVFNPNLPD